MTIRKSDPLTKKTLTVHLGTALREARLKS